MVRSFRLLIVALALLLPSLAFAQSESCSLDISVSCTNGQCTATTRNIGTNTCSGSFFTGFFVGLPSAQVTLSNHHSSLGLDDCFGSGDIDAEPDGQVYVFCFGEGALAPGNSFTDSVTVSAAPGAPSPLPIVALTGVYDPTTDEDLGFVYAFNDLEIPSCTPRADVPSITQSGVPYNVSWGSVSSNATTFEVQESTSPDFSANVTTAQVTGSAKQFNHNVSQTTTYYYRVRSTNCGGGPGPYSNTVSIVVQAQPPATASSHGVDTVVPAGTTTPYSFSLFIPGPGASGKRTLDATTFGIGSDQPYITVNPPSGELPPQGTTVTVTVNPSGLPPGASTGTLSIATTSAGKTSTSSVPVSVTTVTPVTNGGKGLPPANALIIPVVTHVNGVAGPFQSDVRLTNGTPSVMTYQVTMTPSRTDGTKNGKSTTITVNPNQTVAFNDIAKDFFGFGATGDPNDVGFGALEIRPLNSSSFLTFASSRTYASTSSGTFGQFIAPIPFGGFATNAGGIIPGSSSGESAPLLSLQQVAQSSKFRTNLGLVEGSGQPASGTIRIFDDNGTMLKAVPFSLLPGEHQQLNSFITATAGLPSLEDGRIEIAVESDTGAVTAYASVLDNITTDPLAVMPVTAADISETRYVLPGIADLNNGAANFHSDIRIFNGGPTTARATLTYFPQSNVAGAKTVAPITIAPGQVKALDNVLPSVFTTSNSGGSILITTDEPSSLVATGRTYSIASNGGTFGLFAPSASPSDGVGAADRGLEVLQLEQSANFRSNLGLAELTGKPVHVRISLVVPDATVAPVVDLDLAGNEFRQLGSVIASLLPGKSVYNARMTVRVVSGEGRITAYGSVIDNATQDPTFVPAQ